MSQNNEFSDVLHYEGSLHLPGDLELSFRQDYNLRLMRIARPGMALSILVNLSFWILDLFALPQAYRAIWLIRLIGIIIMTGLVIFSFSVAYKKPVCCAIQITESTYNLIKHEFTCKSIGFINVKGKDDMPVWHVEGRNHARDRNQLD